MRWIESGRGAVPTEFARLLARRSTTRTFLGAIEKLIAAKRAGNKLDNGPRMPIISDFIDREMARFEARETPRLGDAPAIDELNEVFRSVLTEFWADGRHA